MKNTGRVAALKRYAHDDLSMNMIREMVQDGLSDEDIKHALGYDGEPDTEYLPEDPAPAEEIAEQAEQPKKMEPAKSKEVPKDPLHHLAALLTHLTQKPSQD